MAEGGTAVRIQQDRFQIFVSHKHADREVADTVKSELEKLSPSIRCWVSGQDISAASEWRREIRNGLGDSHLLILLFTTPAHTWDWCLYEVGLFTRFDVDDVSSVVCLFDPSTQTPGPLAHVQGVPAEAVRIQHSLLVPLMRETWRVSDDWLRGPLAPEIDDAELEAAATAIASAFRGAVQGDDTYHPVHRIVLDLTDRDCGGGIPANATVREGVGATTGFTLSLFGRAEGPRPRTWGEIVAAIGGERAQWRRQLDEHFDAVCREDLFESMNEPFATWSRDRMFRPIISEVRRSRTTGRPTEVTIVLVRDYAPPVIGGPAFNLLRSNARFRSEVFDVYRGDLSDHLAADGVDVYEAIRGAFRHVEYEAEALGVFTDGEVRAAYGADYDESGVHEIGARWLAARARLDDALDERDRERTVAELETLSELNREFMIRAAERYRKVLSKEG